MALFHSIQRELFQPGNIIGSIKRHATPTFPFPSERPHFRNKLTENQKKEREWRNRDFLPHCFIRVSKCLETIVPQ